MPNDRAATPEVVERRIAAEIEALGLPTPTGSELPLVDGATGLQYAQLGTAGIADDAITSAKIALGAIVNLDVATNAGILVTKLAPGTAGQILVSNATPAPAWTTLSGDVTVDSAGVTAIGSGVIVNADVNASAGIQLSKLENVTAGRVVLGNGSNVPTATALSGDVTVNSSGVTAIGSGVIVDADVNASAGIAHSKLAAVTAGSVLLGNGSNVATATALSGDVTVNSSGVTAISAGAVTIADLATGAGEIAGTWTTWTPTTGNVTGANTRTGYYLKLGKTFIFQLTMATGNTATAAAAITFTLPTGITAARTQVLSGRTSTNVGLCTVSSGTITLQANATGGNFTAGQALGSVNIGGTIEVS